MLQPGLEPAALQELGKLTLLQSLKLGGDGAPSLDILMEALPALAHLIVQSSKGPTLHLHTHAAARPYWLR